jgi:hypothetical protein
MVTVINLPTTFTLPPIFWVFRATGIATDSGLDLTLIVFNCATIQHRRFVPPTIQARNAIEIRNEFTLAITRQFKSGVTAIEVHASIASICRRIHRAEVTWGHPIIIPCCWHRPWGHGFCAYQIVGVSF